MDAVDDAPEVAAQALARAGIRLAEVHDAADCLRLSQVLGRVWGRPGTELLDPALLVAMAGAGNHIALAFREDEPIGGAVGFCGPPDWPFHSHIVGLLPEAAGRGAGRAIKLAQRAWCLERGVDRMTWTFDPLVRRNAHFNIRVLGARPVAYLPSLYGELRDAINAGQDSDRALVAWDLSARPGSPAASAAGHAAVSDADGIPTPYAPPPPDATTALVGVPHDVEGMRHADPDRAREWRVQVRAALTDLLAAGWIVDGFTDAGQYALRRRDKDTA
jgi:predicted GNAT superfamily acetyltransferase